MKFLSFSQTKLGSSLSLPACLCVNARRQAHGWVGTRATSFFLAAYFCRAKYEFRWRPNRGRGNPFPKPRKFLLVDSLGVEPRTRQCECRVIPLYYEPV